MAKRTKNLEKGIESLKEQIEEHFVKLDNDILENNETLAKYHAKEIDTSLIDALEDKINKLGADKENLELIEKYKTRLDEYKRKLARNRL